MGNPVILRLGIVPAGSYTPLPPSIETNLQFIMAAKKTAKKTTESASKKAAAPVAKKAAKKAAKKTATKAAKAPTAKAAPPVAKIVTSDMIARAAYLIYRRRVEQGLPGDSREDWLEAERQLSKA